MDGAYWAHIHKKGYEVANIAFLKHVYYYPQGDALFTIEPFNNPPKLYWGANIGYTTMTRKEFTALVLSGTVIRICDL